MFRNKFFYSSLFVFFSLSSAQAKIMPAAAVPYYVLGLNWQRKNNLSESEKSFRKAISLFPSDADLRASLADILWRENKMEEALSEFAIAIKLNPKNARLRILYGKALLNTKYFAEAINEYKIAVELEPNYPYIYYNLGQAELLSNNPQQAIIYLERALEADNQNLKIINDIAISQHKIGLFDQAINNYKFILSQEKNNDLVHTNLAKALFEKGDWSAAEQEYNELLLRSPKRIDLLSSMSDLQYKKGNLKSAIIYTEKAIQVQPDSASLHGVLASYLEQDKNLKDSLYHYQIAVQKEENIETKNKYFLAIAQIHFKKGDYIKAGSLIEDLLNKNSNDYSLKIQLADIRLWQKKYTEAVSLYQEVLILQSQYMQNKALLFNYGASLNGAKDWKNAEIVWNNYHKLENKNKDSWLNLANAQIFQKKYTEAINAYKTAQNLGANKISTLSEIANLQILINDFTGAEMSYRELMSLQPKQSKHRIALSKVLIKQGKEEAAMQLLKDETDQDAVKLRLDLAERIINSGDYYSAISEYQKIITDEPNNLNAILGLADSYSAIGQFNEASKLYKKYLTNYPNSFHAQYNYALALSNSGKENDSINEYKKAIDLNPNYSESYYSLGAVLMDKDMNQAREYWKKYLEVEPQGEYKNEIFHYFPDLKSN